MKVRELLPERSSPQVKQTSGDVDCLLIWPLSAYLLENEKLSDLSDGTQEQLAE